MSRGGVDLSENWTEDAKATLAGVERILAVDATGGATIVRPHAGRASRFQPLVNG